LHYENLLTHGNKNSNNNLTNTSPRRKIDIKNEKIKDILEKTKKKGYYAPYFSLCKNCNDRNNDFYNQINLKNAIGIINIITKSDKKPLKLEKF